MASGDSTLLKGALGVLCAVGTIALFMPKCPAEAIKPLVTAHKTDTAPKGLRITSAPPIAARNVINYPEGLDPQRLQYLVEVNTDFAAPKMMSFNKTVTDADNALVAALTKLNYIETQPDGSLGFTRDGLLHVSGAVDQGTSWSVPVAKRTFLRVVKLDCTGDNCSVEFLWQWQPNEIGTAAGVATQPFPADATLNATDHHWLLNGVTGL